MEEKSSDSLKNRCRESLVKYNTLNTKEKRIFSNDFSDLIDKDFNYTSQLYSEFKSLFENEKSIYSSKEEFEEKYMEKYGNVNPLFKTEKGGAIIMDNVIRTMSSKREASSKGQKIGVALGHTGVGKTTLLNKVCGTNHQSGAGVGSITRNLYYNDVSCGNHSFSLIDTPGKNSKSEAYKHAYLMREALITKKINTIFLIIKYEARYDTMLDVFMDLLEPVYKYPHKIVVMISHWDLCKDPKKEFPVICDTFKESSECIICYSETSAKEELANIMYFCISKMELEQLDIPEADFFLRYNIPNITGKMLKSYKEFEINTKKLQEEYINFITEHINDSSIDDKDAFVQMLIVSFKDESDEMLKAFEVKYRCDMLDCDFYMFYIKLQKLIISINSTFVEKTVCFMSYDIFDMKDPRNLIKKCPYCGEVWIKVEGCDGQTKCGEKPNETTREVSGRSFFKYVFSRIRGVLNWKKNSLPSSSTNNTPNKGNTKVQGCGKYIVWKDMPKIEDKLILELFEVKSMEEVKEIMKNKGKLVERYKSTIDSTFHN